MARQGERDGLVPLDELGRHALAADERDVSGWEVMAADGTHVGRVEAVLVDAAGGRIRYLEVAIARQLAPGRQDRHVLVPREAVRLASNEHTVVVERLRGEDVTNLPPYGQEPVTREFELELKDRIGERFGPTPVEERGFLGKPTDQERDAAG